MQTRMPGRSRPRRYSRLFDRRHSQEDHPSHRPSGANRSPPSPRSPSDPENHEGSPMKFIAIDFETATCSADSACALGIVSIEKGRITKSEHRLIRPPRRHFTFSYLHGISWTDVKAEPTFIKVWEGLTPLWEGADYFLAHNAPFDRNVLAACCSAVGQCSPEVPFICTVQIARSHWNIRPTNLPAVCAQLGIALDHHNAASDALACALIALRAMNEGFPIHSAEVGRHHKRPRPRRRRQSD